VSATSMSEPTAPLTGTRHPTGLVGTTDPGVRTIRLGDSGIATMRSHHCFACGDLNVQGLRLSLHLDHGRCWTETTLDPRFAGWEGVAHGGILCAVLDEVMAWALITEDCWGMTARMSVDFKRPVQVGRPLRAEGRFVDRRRRLLRTDGQILDQMSGELLATAQGTYLDAPSDRKDELKRRYEYRVLPG